MPVKSVFLATLLAASLSVGGTAFAGSPNHGPNPCEQPEAMPEYCTNPTGDGDPGEPEPKPGHDITDLTAKPGSDLDVGATRRPGVVFQVKAGKPVPVRHGR